MYRYWKGNSNRGSSNSLKGKSPAFLPSIKAPKPEAVRLLRYQPPQNSAPNCFTRKNESFVSNSGMGRGNFRQQAPMKRIPSTTVSLGISQKRSCIPSRSEGLAHIDDELWDDEDYDWDQPKPTPLNQQGPSQWNRSEKKPIMRQIENVPTTFQNKNVNRFQNKVGNVTPGRPNPWNRPIPVTKKPMGIPVQTTKAVSDWDMDWKPQQKESYGNMQRRAIFGEPSSSRIVSRHPYVTEEQQLFDGVEMKMQDSSMAPQSEDIEAKIEEAQAPKVFTVSVAKLRSWSKNVSNDIIFEVFGILNSITENGPPGTCIFTLKGQPNGEIDCIFYEIDRKLRLENFGHWHRCVGMLKGDAGFQCLSVRMATQEEILHLDSTLSANSKCLARMRRSSGYF